MGVCGCFEIRQFNKKNINENEEDELDNIKIIPSILKPYSQSKDNLVEIKYDLNQKMTDNEDINEEDNNTINKFQKNTIIITSTYSDRNKSKNNDSFFSILRYNNNNNSKTDIIIKSPKKGKNEINIVLVGEKESGKSSFVIKITEKRFENLYIPTVFIENISKILTYNNQKYILNFNVTPGVQEYKEDYSDLYSQSNFILLFYDISNQESFNKAKYFVKNELKNKIFMYLNHYSNVIIVANKLDKFLKKNSHFNAKKYWEKRKFQYFEISVKNNIGISYMINKLLAIFEEISADK